MFISYLNDFCYSKIFYNSHKSKVLALIPLISSTAAAALFPFYRIPLVANSLGLYLGNEIFHLNSSNGPKSSAYSLKKLDFLRKHLYIIYLATFITALALVHFSFYSAAFFSLLTAGLLGYAYGHGHVNKDTRTTNQPIAY